jgi:hypothetical protein
MVASGINTCAHCAAENRGRTEMGSGKSLRTSTRLGASHDTAATMLNSSREKD